MADALGRLLADPALAGRLGQAAQTKAKELFDIHRVVAAYETLWK